MHGVFTLIDSSESLATIPNKCDENSNANTRSMLPPHKRNCRRETPSFEHAASSMPTPRKNNARHHDERRSVRLTKIASTMPVLQEQPALGRLGTLKAAEPFTRAGYQRGTMSTTHGRAEFNCMNAIQHVACSELQHPCIQKCQCTCF